jgi:hypothetical protein
VRRRRLGACTNDMFRAMNDIATGNTLLTTAQRKQMI